MSQRSARPPRRCARSGTASLNNTSRTGPARPRSNACRRRRGWHSAKGAGPARGNACRRDDGRRTEKAALTPGPLAPARELVGEMLLLMNQPAEALKEFEATLQHEPNRFRRCLAPRSPRRSPATIRKRAPILRCCCRSARVPTSRAGGSSSTLAAWSRAHNSVSRDHRRAKHPHRERRVRSCR